jgi:hypothetical protein
MGYALCQWGFGVLASLGLAAMLFGVAAGEPNMAMAGLVALLGGAAICLLAQIAERL